MTTLVGLITVLEVHCYLCSLDYIIVKQLKCKFMDKCCGLDVHKDCIFAIFRIRETKFIPRNEQLFQ